MKKLVAFVLGIPCGVALLAAGLYFNPLSSSVSLSPLAVSSLPQLVLSYSAVPTDALLFTNDGDSVPEPYPAKAAELWDATLRNSRVAIVEIRNGRGEPVGVGIKFSTDSEATRLLDAEALVDSAWHVYLPARGTFFVGQRENYWSFLRDVVVQAEMNSADNWRGTWSRALTIGPNALGTGRVSGGSGEFAGLDSEVVETLNASAYSSTYGPVAMSGSLTITLNDGDSVRTARQAE